MSDGVLAMISEQLAPDPLADVRSAHSPRAASCRNSVRSAFQRGPVIYLVSFESPAPARHLLASQVRVTGSDEKSRARRLLAVGRKAAVDAREGCGGRDITSRHEVPVHE
jgi:hypothetical protein